MASLDDIREVNETGIRALMGAHRWGGATFHDAGWNPRHIEGVEHFFFYNLERLTGKHFIHGQPVGLGIYIGSLLQENQADLMLSALHRVGVDIRPEAMGVDWVDVAARVTTLQEFTEIRFVVHGCQRCSRNRVVCRSGPRGHHRGLRALGRMKR
ncbi:MAG TPA: hypothetical protein VMS99_12175 [Acidimicrobiia bacterium]|nr:hypothetical protein [Acidimicrobiia bacterium]